MDRFLVYETDDWMYASICIGAAEASQIADGIGWDNPNLRVMRITDGELCRDVTDDFRPVETEQLIGTW